MRTLSSTALQSIFAQETDEVWLFLLNIAHPDLSETLRFVNNNESILSRGENYIAFPFELEIPQEDPDVLGEARITIDNIDRSIVLAIRELQSSPTITFEVILASDPDTVEASFAGMTLRGVSYDQLVVRGTLQFEDIVSEPVSIEMTPARFPALF